MRPQRIAVKFFVAPDPTAAVDLHPFVPLFHRFIQERALEGLLIDVADYAHVPNGPGVLLVGHEVDYGIDLRDGRTGLLTTLKRAGDRPLEALLRDALRKALIAVLAIQADASAGLRFATGAATLEVLDRLAGSADQEGYEALVKQAEPVLREIYGDGALELRRGRGDDPRRPLTLVWSAGDAPDAAVLLERLGGAEPRSSEPPQSPWDVSVEQLARMRDEKAEFVLVDVREPHEYEICNLGGRLIPLGALTQRLAELDATAHVIVHCKVGVRGAKAVAVLREAGFANAWNLRGGIFAWIDRVDSRLPKY